MDYTVHGILQARMLEWVAFPFSRQSSQPRDRGQVSHIAGGFFTSRATREACLVAKSCPTPWAAWIGSNPCPWSHTIQPSHPLLPPSPALNLSQHQGLFHWVHSASGGQSTGNFSFSISPSEEYSRLISDRPYSPIPAEMLQNSQSLTVHPAQPGLSHRNPSKSHSQCLPRSFLLPPEHPEVFPFPCACGVLLSLGLESIITFVFLSLPLSPPPGFASDWPSHKRI